MNTKVIAIVGALAVVVAVGAIVTGKKGSTTTQVDAPSELLLPALDKRINDVARIQIEDATTSVTLTRTEGVWRVEQSQNYPANFTPISQLVGQLAELKKVEQKTANPELYTRLDVEDIGPSAKGKLVRLADDKGTEISSVIIGKSWFPQGGGGGTQYRYARVASEKASWLVSGNLNVQTTTRSWVNAEIASIPNTRVQNIVIEHADGERVEINKAKESDANYMLVTLPAMRELTAESRPNELASALSSLRFDDVAKADTITGATPESTFTATTFDGLVTTAKAYRVNDKVYLAFRQAADASVIERVNAERKAEADASNEANKDVKDYVPLEPQIIQTETIMDEAEKFNGTAANWVYVLPSWQQERFQRRNEFFLKAATDEEVIGGPVPEESDAETTPSATPESIVINPEIP